LSCSIPDNGLLNLARRQFVYLQSSFGHGCQGRTTRLAHDESRLQILGVKQAFYYADLRLVPLKNVAHNLRNPSEAT
jgi:hypothetical protein